MKLIRKLAVVIFLLSPLAANADLIDAGGSTIDTASGLEWLDLGFTYGLSYNSIYADGGLAETDNWRHATDAELRALLTSSLGLPLDTVLQSAAVGTWTEVIAFLNLIGPGQTATFGGDGNIKTVYSVDGYLDSPLASENILSVGLLQAADGTVVAVGPFVTLLQTQLNTTGVDADQGLSNRGHFLVRETISIPEPSTLALLSLGLLGLGLSRRKKV